MIVFYFCTYLVEHLVAKSTLLYLLLVIFPAIQINAQSKGVKIINLHNQNQSVNPSRITIQYSFFTKKRKDHP